jgi:multicomponent Na+:H+ antiporter subunit E
LIILKRYSGLSHIDVKGKSDFEKAAIANSISLTPKTLVLFEEDDKLIVHKVSSNPEEAHRADNIWKDDII